MIGSCGSVFESDERTPSSEEWFAFMEAFHVCTGIDLSLYKSQQLQRRLLEMMRRNGDETLEHFWDRISGTLGGLSAVVDALAINVTELYRDPHKWVELKDRILPDLTKRTRQLKCWSAGCSFGAEAHTLAIVLDVHYPGNHLIRGTDIDGTALRKAERGEFTAEEMTLVPKEVRAEYFHFEERTRVWRANERLQKFMDFRKENLLADKFDEDYDLILCRNVVIYFKEAAKEVLFRKFFQALKPGGVLFVGSTERILSADEIGFESSIPFFYRKPMIG